MKRRLKEIGREGMFLLRWFVHNLIAHPLLTIIGIAALLLRICTLPLYVFRHGTNNLYEPFKKLADWMNHCADTFHDWTDGG